MQGWGGKKLWILIFMILCYIYIFCFQQNLCEIIKNLFQIFLKNEENVDYWFFDVFEWRNLYCQSRFCFWNFDWWVNLEIFLPPPCYIVKCLQYHPYSEISILIYIHSLGSPSLTIETLEYMGCYHTSSIVTAKIKII